MNYQEKIAGKDAEHGFSGAAFLPAENNLANFSAILCMSAKTGSPFGETCFKLMDRQTYCANPSTEHVRKAQLFLFPAGIGMNIIPKNMRTFIENYLGD
ncbi:hypothetical protein [Brucella abortus]|uniref:hypothetical protein n=1 Tax=Brucella abortus TaxID=235 RepID=UPI0001B56896|nr:hypothetical protein [Brucella abortus]EEX80849.1 predicted protein [Brucella abortus bv. 9 str. C68]